MVAAKHPSHGAGEPAVAITISFDQRSGTSRDQLGEHLSRRIFSVAYAGHQVVRTAKAIIRCDFLEFFVPKLLERDTVFPGFLLDELASKFDRTLPLMHVQPMLDLVARARGLDHREPIPAGPVARLRENLDDVTAVQAVP